MHFGRSQTWTRIRLVGTRGSPRFRVVPFVELLAHLDVDGRRMCDEHSPSSVGDPLDRRPSTLDEAGSRETVQRPGDEIDESGVGRIGCALGKIVLGERETTGERTLNFGARPLVAVFEQH